MRFIPRILMIVMLSAAQAVAQEDTEPAASPVRDSAADRRAQPLWRFDVALEGIYDSNVNFSSTELGSVGMQTSAVARYQNRASWPTFHAQYGIAQHWYEATDQWDRISHNLRLSHIVRSADRKYRLETVGQAQINGWTVDRELADLYILSPRFDYLPSRSHRVRLIATYREKRFDEDDPDPDAAPTGSAGRDSKSPWVGVEYRRFFGSTSHYWQLGIREEENDAQNPLYSYGRTTVSTFYVRPLSDRDTLSARIDFRDRRWDARVVPGSGEPRVDRRWTPSIAWTRSLSQQLVLELSYQYDNQNSNHPTRDFDRNRAAVAARYSW